MSAKNYENLRTVYKEFIFNAYEINVTDTRIDIIYRFEIPNLARFNPAWSFRLPRVVNYNALSGLVFSLGLTELISYWKICCPPIVRVNAGFLSDTQTAWWKKLYKNGLGEFFYINAITPGDDFMRIIPCEQTPRLNNTKNETNGTYCTEARSSISSVNTLKESADKPKVLVPIGGGKDSVVTLELLSTHADIYGYIINPRKASLDTAVCAGIENSKLIIAKRILDKRMLELNKEGYLNGHTPFSAVAAFSSVLAAYACDIKYVALSNESSANEPTTTCGVNHQYSKSFEFETDFRRYQSEFLRSNTEYFSLLRPLLEIQIAREFAKHKQYHKVFKSCNAASKTDEWCGKCPKCLFVYIILSPFVPQAELAAIFGKNLFEDTNLLKTLDELTGFAPEKPFECVGRRDEAVAALSMTVLSYAEQNKPLPPLLARFKELNGNNAPAPETVLTYFDTENAVPALFSNLVSACAKISAQTR